MSNVQSDAPPAALVFDLDGTLVDSLGDIARAVNTVLAVRGLPVHEVEGYRPWVGWGLQQLLVSAAPAGTWTPGELERAHRDALSAYEAQPTAATAVYPGILSLLTAWAERVPLAVYTNKDEGVARQILAALFRPGLFRAVLGARPDRVKKPDPAPLLDLLSTWGLEPASCVYLGDSGVDMTTARRAGCVACGAAWGYRDAAELREAGAHAVFATAPAFGAWLDGDRGQNGAFPSN